ncbi:MAG: lysoplasmalogenase [Prolixibacteraceae bacterium]|nr:lysoplasmalogenase [Prolixibacteraceae bacterium]
MFLSALNRKDRVPARSFGLVFGGAVLFVLSDCLIAISQFVEKVPYSGLFVMSTYIAAQSLIMYGILHQMNSECIASATEQL